MLAQHLKGGFVIHQANLLEALRDSRTRLAFGASVQPRRFAAEAARSAPEGLPTGLSHGQDRDFGDQASLHTQDPTQTTP